jgi:hypothetical protein
MAEHIDTIADTGRQYSSHEDMLQAVAQPECPPGGLADDPPGGNIDEAA